jgi:predicted HAD superfamily hydrolase
MSVDPSAGSARRDRVIARAPAAALREELAAAGTRVLSSDIFDTVILRDSSTETQRFAESARLAADRLGIDEGSLITMRWESHANAYRAVAMERPGGDARFATICLAAITPLGLGPNEAEMLHDAELEVDSGHLRPNHTLLALLEEERAAGRRVIAVSDIYYSSTDVEELLIRVTGTNPFDAVYTSSDLKATKLAGTIFPRVAGIEGVGGGDILHIGDNLDSDVNNARTAGWRAVHAPRGRVEELGRFAGRIRTVGLRWRRDR